MNGDDVNIEIENDKGEIETRYYRANRYISEYYGSEKKMTDDLFRKNIISYKLIADTLGLTETLVRNAMTLETKSPQLEVRRRLHIFFNNDFYEKTLSPYATKCTDCTKRACKQDYWVEVISCRKYNKKK